MGVIPSEPYNFNRLKELESEFLEQKASIKRYRFWGEKKDKKYTVRLINGEWSCTCNGYAYRGECKHIEMGKEMLSYEEMEDE